MKYINQSDYPHWLYLTRTDMDGEELEKGKTTTVLTSACGLCSAVMAADRLLPNCEFSLSDAIDLSYEVKANHRKGTSYSRFAPAFAEKLGLRLESSREPEDVLRCLRTGGAVVFLVGNHGVGKPGLFTRSAHYITAINEEPDGRIAILDPYLYEGKFEEEGRQGKVEMKNGVIVLCSLETLDQEAKLQNSVPYYLFWRK